jgi:hypothetical protein
MMRPAAGDFAALTTCRANVAEKPAIGGIVICKDKESRVTIARGTWRRDDISFRGRLPGDQTFLRLERIGNGVRALCSSDGCEWLTVRRSDFATENPVDVGVYAIGDIDRIIQAGAFTQGSAIRFESFELGGRRRFAFPERMTLQLSITRLVRHT